MFTGIIEELGTVEETIQEGTNIRLGIKASFVEELRVDESVAHNGICLTVTQISDGLFYVIAIEETLNKTNLPQQLASRSRYRIGNRRWHITMTLQAVVDSEKADSELKSNFYLVLSEALVCGEASKINPVSLQSLSTCFTCDRNKPCGRGAN